MARIPLATSKRKEEMSPVARGPEIGRELTRTLAQVNTQIDEIKKQCGERGIDPFILQDAHGTWVLPPLLAAKAQILHSIVLVNQR